MGRGWSVPVAASILGLLVGAFLVASPPASAAMSRTQVVTPTGDAFVSAAQPRTRFGSARELRVDGKPRERAYLRFRIPALGGRLTRATVRVYSRTTSSRGFVARGMSGSWLERSVTFRTPIRLSHRGTPTGTVRSGTYENIDVTALARNRTTVDLALTAGAPEVMRLASREVRERRPQLVLTSVPFDTLPPQTTITGGPPALTRTRSPSASFALAASEGGSRLECRLDGGAFAACASPKTYTGLGPGVHSFAARAIDAAGNVDTSPASRTWTVDGTAPTVSAVRPADLVEPERDRRHGGACDFDRERPVGCRKRV